MVFWTGLNVLSGFLKEWHCGVRVIKSNKLVGFISAVPANIRMYNIKQKKLNSNCRNPRLTKLGI